MEYKPHPYQAVCIDHVLDNPFCGLFLGVGLGKTSITLSALEYLLMSTEISKPLIIAPKLVTEQTWQAEIEKWDHLRGLKLSRIIGTEKQRIRALNTPADMYAVSRDNIAWLVGYMAKQRGKRWPFDFLIIDELSSFKNRDSVRFKALRKVRPHVRRVVGLTGTPAPNSLLDLWPQMFLLDMGDRLGKTLTGFRDFYFIGNYNGFGYTIREGVSEEIHQKVSDICISMTAKDYLDLPPRVDVVREVTLANKSEYDLFKKEEYLKLDSAEITPLSAAALYSKLLQYCNGAVYDEDKNYHTVDGTKLAALVEEYEALQGEPVLIFYEFKSDAERIKKAIPEAVAIKTKQDIDDWNAGKIKCAVVHPASIGHGVNLQEGGYNIFWFGLPWSLELYIQAVGRLDRQGITRPVINTIFIAKGTVEELIVKPRLEQKALTQDELILYLKKHLS